jgi:hypothetical protein
MGQQECQRRGIRGADANWVNLRRVRRPVEFTSAILVYREALSPAMDLVAKQVVGRPHGRGKLGIAVFDLLPKIELSDRSATKPAQSPAFSDTKRHGKRLQFVRSAEQGEQSTQLVD